MNIDWEAEVEAEQRGRLAALREVRESMAIRLGTPLNAYDAGAYNARAAEIANIDAMIKREEER